MNPLAKIALAVVTVVGLAIVALLLVRGCGGEAGRIDAMLREALQHAQAGDAERCIGYIAPDYSHEGSDYAAVCAVVRRYIGPGKWKTVVLRGLEASVEGDEGRATMWFFLEGGELREFGGQPFPLELHLRLRKVGADWKISGYNVRQR